MNISDHWIANHFKNWTDDDLHDRMRELDRFGGTESEKAMIKMESKRREREVNELQR